MRLAIAILLLIPAALCQGADLPPHATRFIEGSKTTFPAKSLDEGVKTLSAVLASCHDISDDTIIHTADDIKLAREKEHVRLLFPMPLKVKVLKRELEATEVVFANGVFWLQCGDEVVRCTKYEFDKMDRFLAWYRQTLPIDPVDPKPKK